MPNNSIFKERQTEKIPLNTEGEIVPILPEKIDEQKRDVTAFQTILSYLLSGSTEVAINEDYLDSLTSSSRSQGLEYPIRKGDGSTSGYTTRRVTNGTLRDGDIRAAVVTINKEQAEFFKKLLVESRVIENELEETSRSIRAFETILSYLLSVSTEVAINEDYLDSLTSSSRSQELKYPIRTGDGSSSGYTTRRVTNGTLRDGDIRAAVVTINKEQAEFFKKLLVESRVIENELEETSRSIRAFETILSYLLSVSTEVAINEDYLDSLTSSSRSQELKYPIRTGDGSSSGYTTRRVTNGTLRDGDIRAENVRLSQNDLPRLKEILKYSKDTSQAISKNFIIYIKALLENVDSAKQEELLDTLQAIFAEDGRLEELDILIPSINEFIEFYKFRKFQIEILQELNRNISIEQIQLLIIRIQTYEYKNNETAAGVDDLLKRAIKKKDNIYISQSLVFITQLGAITESTQATRLVNTLINSLDNIENIQIRGILTNLAQKRELALIRRRLYQEIREKKTPEQIFVAFEEYQSVNRPSVDVNNFDYTEILGSYIDNAVEISRELRELDLERLSYFIRLRFGEKSFDEVIASIDAIPLTSDKARVIKIQLLQFYRKYLTENNITEFNERFGNEINRILEEEKKRGFQSAELGKNKESFAYLRERFRESILPLFSFLRSNPETSSATEPYYERTNQGYYRIITKILQKQREERGQELTEEEKKYLESVELLSLFNPMMVACLRSARELSRNYLEYFFTSKSRKTQTELIRRQEEEPGEVVYYPLVQIGLGPNGLASLGEIARNNPDLSSRMLTIDAGSQPGGPFAIPGGPAWRLNSASSRGIGRVIPDSPESLGTDQKDTIRFYGSPLRTNPGERIKNQEVRLGGDINTTVDYFPVLSDFSGGRYPSNDELGLLLSMQASVLVNNLCLETKVLKVERNNNPDIKGTKIVTLEITTPEGKRIVKISTDAVFVATGLGEPTYGIKLQGSEAERIIKESRDLKFPKISTTLESFRYFVSTSKNPELNPREETIVIWGGGNSADTLIEYIGELFSSNNPNVRNITKIYVITKQDLSTRPRYAQIRDLRSRNGQGNLVEIISSRVEDVDYVSTQQDVKDRKIRFFDKEGKVILDSNGREIRADYGIAATGFRSTVDQIFSDFIPEGETRIKRTDITLPTNNRVPVAESVENDPTIVFLGTASDPKFQLLAKLRQLPKEAREALLRNGAENAVAIGFRAPDVQAAVNIFLNSFDVDELLTEVPIKETLDLTKEITGLFQDLQVPVILSREEIAQIEPNRDSLDEVNNFIFCQFALNLGEIKTDNPLEIELDISLNDGSFKISPAKKGEEMPAEVSKLLGFLNDVYIQKSIFSYLNGFRKSKSLRLNIKIRNGKIDFQNTYLE